MSSKDKKILIIEDEKDLIKNLGFALGPDCEVLSATSGKEGFRKAKKEIPDLILLDLMLPDADGAEILKELKTDEDTNAIPVVVLTNLSDKETVSKIIAAGGKEYLVKADWSINEVVNKIKASL